MREIKFRGKTVNGNEWIYGMTISNGTIKRKANKVFMEVEENRWKGLQDGSLGQYTGLKDKNGKEIYEGDIVEWVFFYERLGANMGVKECDTIVKGIIRWKQGGFILEVIENDFENAGYYSISALYTDTESDVEVIGNIYDTPKLIKEEEK